MYTSTEETDCTTGFLAKNYYRGNLVLCMLPLELQGIFQIPYKIPLQVHSRNIPQNMLRIFSPSRSSCAQFNARSWSRHVTSSPWCWNGCVKITFRSTVIAKDLGALVAGGVSLAMVAGSTPRPTRYPWFKSAISLLCVAVCYWWVVVFGHQCRSIGWRV